MTQRKLMDHHLRQKNNDHEVILRIQKMDGLHNCHVAVVTVLHQIGVAHDRKVMQKVREMAVLSHVIHDHHQRALMKNAQRALNQTNPRIIHKLKVR